ATHVRFLFGWPFACLFFVVLTSIYGFPAFPNLAAISWTGMGAMAQIVATGLMLEAMRSRSFVVTIAYTKTEPVQVAVFALIFLGERVSLMLALAIFIATAGVMVMSLKKNAFQGPGSALKPALLGIGSGTLFAFAAIGYRGGVQAIEHPSFVVAATTTLLIALTLQTLVVSLWLLIRSPQTMGAILRSWHPSIAAGFLGAFASQMWFLAFVLESAARVRTLALVEILFAGVISRRFFSQTTGGRDYFGIVLVISGVILLLNSS
ncbi:MAG: DMT family transporter, partial [Fimbriimonadaceae bacterium]|nr:DMT family transporter [Alphaproteobacteria bacterium]